MFAILCFADYTLHSLHAWTAVGWLHDAAHVFSLEVVLWVRCTYITHLMLRTS